MNTKQRPLYTVLFILFMVALPLSVSGQEATPDVTPDSGVTPVAVATDVPTETATNIPTETAIDTPTETATDVPTPAPTDEPTQPATEIPTDVPTETPVPTETVIVIPTDTPTEIPLTVEPTLDPTATPDVPPQIVVGTVCNADGITFTVTNQGGTMIEPSSYLLVVDPAYNGSVVPVLVGPPVVSETPAPVVSETPAPVVVEEDENETGDETLTGDVAITDAASTDAPAPTDAVETDAPATEIAPEVTPEPEVVVTAEPEAIITPAPELPVQVWPHAFTLATDESFSLVGGFGTPVLNIGSIVVQPETPCLPAPVITVTAQCVFETGITYTVANTGGPMTEPLAYSIIANPALLPTPETLAGQLQLPAASLIEIAGGYGQPTFAAGDITNTLETPCYAPADVFGVVWQDTDSDGVRTEADAVLAGVPVTLSDSAGFAITTTTGETGGYLFSMLRTGSYTVSADESALSGDAFALTPTTVVMDVLAGRNSELDFAFGVDAQATISGTVWLDIANWGVRDGDEPAVYTAQVELVNAAGIVLATVPVDAVTGAYTFTAVPEGGYTVRLIEASLFAPYGITFDVDGDFNLETPVTVLHAEAAVNVDFGVVGTF